MDKNKLNNLEVWFLIYGMGLLALTIICVGYSLFFLSDRLLHAFSHSEQRVEQINFDIEGFKKLNL